MFGVRLQRHNGTECLCNGSHEHAPWSITNGVFDTSLEAEYTPKLAKALATAILEAIANRYKLQKCGSVFKEIKAVALPCPGLSQATVQITQYAGGSGFFHSFGNFQCAARDFTSGTRLFTGQVSVSLVLRVIICLEKLFYKIFFL